jgi:transglutaminase-like putative cysteine protease
LTVRKLVLLVITAVVVLSLVMAGSFILFINNRAAPGFDVSSLSAPSIVIESPVERIHHDTSLTAAKLNLEMSWTITPVYSGYGGVMNVTITNHDPTTVYIYGYGVVWENSPIESWRNTSVLIPAEQQRSLGFLFFQAPANATQGYYTIMLKVEVQNTLGTGWKDNGEYGMAGYKRVSFESPLTYLNHTTATNNPVYYSKVNKRIDMDATKVIVSNILVNNSNLYSIQAVADAFDWVRDNIVYADDPNDYWQSTSETLSWRTGDCEDQAILLASMIGEMGGNARVNIIDGHAFPSVFVGSNINILANLTKAISSHYQTQVPVYFLNDTTGYWMVIDTTGFPYAGGLVTLSGPVLEDAAHIWSFESSTWLSQVDATGSTQGSGLLPFQVE